MEDKQKIVYWLQDNIDKPEEEVKIFLTSNMERQNILESWQKYYFLEELKASLDKCSKYILGIIDDLEKEFGGVPMWKRNIACVIDLIILSLVISLIGESVYVDFYGICIYFIYFIGCIYKFETTIGLYIFKIKIVSEIEDRKLLRLVIRELLFITLLSGIGFIAYLFYGPYWDKNTKFKATWIK